MGAYCDDWGGSGGRREGRLKTEVFKSFLDKIYNRTK